MRSGKCYFLYVFTLAIAFGSLVSTGCRKQNGIDNNNVIRTPYGLWFADRLGSLYVTNDGKTIKDPFKAGNGITRAITTSGDNILWVLKNLHVSDDEAENFNPKNYTVTPSATWQSLILGVPSHDNRVYLASTKGNGIEYSEDNGMSWQIETSFNTTNNPAPSAIHSFTQLKNGNLFAMNAGTAELYIRTGLTAQWDPKIPNTALPAGGTYYLSHFNNTLIAADANGTQGIHFSNNDGADWAPYPGIPTNQDINAVAAPLDQVLLAGVDSAGIYRLVGTSFQPSNNGLEPFTTVYGIVGKQDTYKNEVIKQYVYIATNKGLYRSEDLGQNWVLMYAGDIRALY